ncbi:acyl-CoA dehydrogenase family protein [Nocardioides sp. LML1-1-1.1]|uniref:acyl-CoA dehydrogenase family protein n=1 Tax=Nocardioides sp. LML1-1-1.1 TaxID=3135248 RepID=UPI00344081B9
MHIDLEPQQLALREELRDYFAQLVTPEIRAGLASATGEFGEANVYKDVIRQIGKDGWLGIGWPKEYGGQARSMVEQLIFTDAAAVAGVPIPYLTLNTVGPTIMRFGSEEQKEYFLPKILAGELHFSIGYSEPGSGTDLASLQTKATLDPSAGSGHGEWVINGQKMWTSLIQYADWIWLACRTEPDAPRHKGLSMILVPADAPGVTYTPVHTVAGVGTSATYYSDVRVPASNLISERGGGWALMTNQLNHERVALTSAAPLVHSLALVKDWARETGVIDTEWVQIALGRAHARVEALSLINWKLAADADHGVALSPAEASATKIYGSELATEVYRSLMEIVGPHAGVTGDCPGAVLAGRLERMHRSSLVMTFGGGTNEIQRDIIGYVGLGLPAAKR